MSAIIHVGFAHSGTTSLQQNLFLRRSEFLYCGLPYGEIGGIFSELGDRKFQDDTLAFIRAIGSFARRRAR